MYIEDEVSNGVSSLSAGCHKVVTRLTPQHWTEHNLGVDSHAGVATAGADLLSIEVPLEGWHKRVGC